MGASKNLGYKTAHYIDYDAVFTDYSDFYEKIFEGWQFGLLKK